MSKSLVEYLFANGTGLCDLVGVVAHILNDLEAVERTEVRNVGNTLLLELLLQGLHVAACLCRIDLEKVEVEVTKEREAISKEMDKLVKGFIQENYENVLGPGVFVMLCNSLPYPIVTPLIEDIMENAPVSFKENLLVKEYMKVARVTNINTAIADLKDRGVWIFGAAGEGSVPMYKADLTGPAAIVIGNEGDGMSQLVRKNCDMLIHIPMSGKISSLNASAAASILLYEAVRQRLNLGA